MKQSTVYPLFRYFFRRPSLRTLTALLAGSGLLLVVGPGECTAFGGAVVLVEDMTDLFKWPRELDQWNRVVEQLELQVKHTANLAKWTGNPGDRSSAIVGGVSSVLDPTQCILALAERKKAQEAGRSVYNLDKTGRSTLHAGDRVEMSYQLLSGTEKRDEKRYMVFSEHAALLARHDEAIRLLRELEQKELKIQRGLLERLRSAKTHAEIAAIQAALTASQQRCGLATNKAEQARDEAARYEAQHRLEQQRKLEADREWTETLVSKLKQRALTSLHAQKGNNS